MNLVRLLTCHLIVFLEETKLFTQQQFTRENKDYLILLSQMEIKIQSNIVHFSWDVTEFMPQIFIFKTTKTIQTSVVPVEFGSPLNSENIPGISTRSAQTSLQLLENCCHTSDSAHKQHMHFSCYAATQDFVDKFNTQSKVLKRNGEQHLSR